MSQLFAKIFQSIYDSSIADDWRTRIVFQDMIVLANEKGVLDMTPESFARRTNIPLDIVKEAIPKLESPDPTSRTPDHEGRRILRLDSHRPWGWQIVNFGRYRESANQAMLRMSEADRKRAYRARFKRPESLSPSPPIPSKTENENERENSPACVRDCPGHVRDNRKRRTGCFASPSLEEIKLEAAKSGLPEIEAEKFFNHFTANGWKVGGKTPMQSWQHALASWKLRCQTINSAKPVSKPNHAKGF